MKKTVFYPASTLILILASSAPAVYPDDATSTGPQSLGSKKGATDTFDLFCPSETTKARVYVQDTVNTDNPRAIVRAFIVNLAGAVDMRDDKSPAPDGEGGGTSASAERTRAVVPAYTVVFMKLTSSSSESYEGYASCYENGAWVGAKSLTRQQNS